MGSQSRLRQGNYMLQCPICRDSLTLHRAEDRRGAEIIVFQCAKCSGIWVDGKVINRLSRDAALRLESDIDFREIFTEPRKTTAICPRCNTYLVEQSGEGFPKGLHIDFCRSCQGFWFDKGELMIYKSHQHNKAKVSIMRKGVGDTSIPLSEVQTLCEILIGVLLHVLD